MKTALVTGSNGFIGRHMSERLKEDNWDVFKIDNSYPSFPVDAVTYLNEATNYVRFDLVVHCAYTVGGRATIDGVNMALAENVMLDAALFKYAVRAKPGAVIYYSSSAAYPVHFQTQAMHKKLCEDDLNLDAPHPDANYGWAKVTGERMAKAASENGARIHVLRPFSGYGEDQSLDYPFPSIVGRAKTGDLSVWGPAGQTRDWIHIDDVVSASLAVYEADERRPINLCTGRDTEMGDLAMMAARLAYSHGWPKVAPTYDESKPTGVFYRVGDPGLMNEHYTAKISLEEGIMRALKIQEV